MSLPAEQSVARDRTIVRVAASVTFLVALDSALFNVTLPAIKNTFRDASPTSLAWVINLYSLTLVAMLVPAGYLADRWGRKTLLNSGIVVFLIGCLSGGMSGSMAQLFAARLLQGIGGSLALPASLTVVVSHFRGLQRGLSIGKWSAAGALAAAIGAPLGAVVMHYSSWQMLFLLHVPVCIWALCRSSQVITNSVGKGNLPGLSAATPLFAAGTALTVAALHPWSGIIRILLISTGITLIALAAVLAGTGNQLVRGFPKSSVAAASSTTFWFGALFGAMFVLYDFMLVYRFDFTASSAALLLGAIPLLSIPVARNSARVHQRFSLEFALVAGGTLLLAGTLVSSWSVGGKFVPAAWTAIVICSGIGVGLCFPSLSIAAIQGAKSDHFALMTGVNQSCRHLGTVIGVATVAFLLSRDFPSSFGKASALLWIFAAFTLVSSTIFALQGGMSRSHDREPNPKLESQPQH